MYNELQQVKRETGAILALLRNMQGDTSELNEEFKMHSQESFINFESETDTERDKRFVSFTTIYANVKIVNYNRRNEHADSSTTNELRFSIMNKCHNNKYLHYDLHLLRLSARTFGYIDY